MNNLEKYKRLSYEDKTNITIYSIYNSIYDVSRNQNVEICDEDAISIQELAHDLYLEDEYFNFSSSKIAYFLAECYVRDDTFLKKIEDIDYDDILQAIDNDDLDFYKEDEMER